jgi:thymidylate synthase
MNTIDKKYVELLQDILDNGVEKDDRTGTGTISVFGRQIRHKMSEGFPLLTTKKIAWNVMVAELLWFLRGDTNIKFLLDYNCNIWNGDAYKRYERANTWELQDTPLMNDFIKRIKEDETFKKTWGELGPIYGRQWRDWNGIDQIDNLITELKTNPDSRRLMVNAWNVAELDQMVLPPCHYGFQVYTRELSIEERLDLGYKTYKELFEPFDFHRVDHEEIDELYPVPRRAISLMWNQRSVDTFLGLPFNIASYGLLLEIIAKEVDMVPDELIGNLGDVHLYKNHIEQAKEQIGRDLTDEERYNKWFNNNVVSGMERFFDPNNLPNFDDPHYEPTPKRTREPFELPTVTITERNWYMHEKVKEHLGPKTFSEKILSYRPDCFELVNYQSHPKIKAPLSN